MKKRGLSILLVLCMVLALLPVMSAPAQAAVIGDDYPANLKAQARDAIVDQWNFYNRECTSFVAWRLNSANGVAFHNYYGGVHWGNASNWGNAAQQIGITVDMNPTVGSVAWMSGGHVAWVAEVNGDNVTVEEYNWDGDGLYHKYTWPKSHYTGFIHIKDLGAPFPLNRDLADDFYAAIIMQDGWKHIAANGDNVEIASQNLNDPKQHWHFKKLSNGRYYITNEYDGRYLDCWGAGTDNGTNVGLWGFSGSAAQEWWLCYDYNNWFSYLCPGHCNRVFDATGAIIEGGTNIELWDFNGGKAQQLNIYVMDNYSKPAKPAATKIESGLKIPAGQPYELTWEASPTASALDQRAYNVVVFDSEGKDIHIARGVTTNSYSYTFPEPGTYSVRITSVNTKYAEYLTIGERVAVSVQTPCELNGHVWDNGVVTQEPTTTAEGVKTFTCTVCGETRTESIPKPTNPFTDVAEGKFYYDPVLWAISEDPQITTGVTKTTFEPDRICTRAHVVTFLWRANGCPNPSNLTSSFKDVDDTSKYYYKAVLWANEQGITTGYSDGTFRPDDECTRGQVVTFLWRAKGSPAPTGVTNPFSDVPTGKYYTNAVLWALKNNITKGRTVTTFGPDDACTRGHVVTFLYRAYA